MLQDKSKTRVLEEELRRFELDGRAKPYTVPLSDLVMMQMVGNFEQFLAELAGGNGGGNGSGIKKAVEMIDETRKAVTTEKLFPSIVQKTIEAQFGDRHAALRELGQNCVESYSPMDLDRSVVFDVTENKEHLVLKVRDYGCGMNLAEIIRDLLIPYNSGKELDPTKIGEHGIGWYSIVDFADVVKVTSRNRKSASTVQTLVYRDENDWKATILPESENGFSKELHRNPFGTEVTAYIPKGTTSSETIREFLFQYLGLVPLSRAEIVYRGEVINTLRHSYQTASPVPVKIGDRVEPLTFGVSKREIRGELHDSRFKLRNQNLDKILFAQQGLYIKSESNPFDSRTIHHQLLADLQDIGMDFWVDVPSNVTLTKGRNNIIADHGPMVLDAMYKGFEELFLDTLLNDEEVLHHKSDVIMMSIAKILSRDYAEIVEGIEENRYAYGRKLATTAAAAGSKIADVTSYAAGKTWEFTCATIEVAGRIARTPLHIRLRRKKEEEEGKTGQEGAETKKEEVKPITLEGIVQKLRKELPKWSSEAAKAVVKWTPYATAAGAAGYGLVLAYETYGNAMLTFLGKAGLYAVGGAATLFAGAVISDGAYRVYKNMPPLKECVEELSDLVKAIPELAREAKKGVAQFASNAREVMRSWYTGVPVNVKLKLPFDLAERARDAYWGVLHKFGLYVDIEQKRERKRQKLIKKISKRYLSRLENDKFYKKIMHKKIIPSTHYYSPHAKEERQPLPDDGFASVLVDAIKGTLCEPSSTYQPRYTRKWRETKVEGIVEKQNVKLSVNDIIRLHLERKLKYQRENSFGVGTVVCNHGDYFVDHNNPIVKTVVDGLDKVIYRVREKYDVRVLEDRLDNVAWLAKETGAALYLLSGIGVLHIFAADALRIVSNPMAQTAVYESVSKLAKIIAKEYKLMREGYRFKIPEGITAAFAKGLIQGLKATAVYSGKAAIGTGKFAYSAGTGFAELARIAATLPYHLASATYDYVAVPIARTMNPARYPEYASSLFKEVCDIYQDHRRWLEHKREEKRQRRESKRQLRLKEAAEKKQSKLKLPQRLKDGISRWYSTSWLKRMFGTGVLLGDYFDDVDESRMSHIVETVGAGGAYLNLIRIVDSIDKLVCDATGSKKRLKIALGYRNSSASKERGFELDKKKGRELHIDTEFHQNIVRDLAYRQSTKKSDPSEIRSNDYHLLDFMLHARAHLETQHELKNEGMMCVCGQCKSDRTKYLQGEHPDDFLDRKNALRRKVVDYMLENGMDIETLVDKCMVDVNEEEDVLNYMAPVELCNLVNLTRRSLHEKRFDYDRLKKQIIESRVKQRQEEAEKLKRDQKYQEYVRSLAARPAGAAYAQAQPIATGAEPAWQQPAEQWQPPASCTPLPSTAPLQRSQPQTPPEQQTPQQPQAVQATSTELQTPPQPYQAQPQPADSYALDLKRPEQEPPQSPQEAVAKTETNKAATNPEEGKAGTVEEASHAKSPLEDYIKYNMIDPLEKIPDLEQYIKYKHPDLDQYIASKKIDYKRLPPEEPPKPSQPM